MLGEDLAEDLGRPRENDDWVAVNAADPLNYRNGRPAAVWQGGEPRWLDELPPATREAAGRLLRLQVPALRDQLLAELSRPGAAAA